MWFIEKKIPLFWHREKLLMMVGIPWCLGRWGCMGRNFARQALYWRVVRKMWTRKWNIGLLYSIEVSQGCWVSFSRGVVELGGIFLCGKMRFLFSMWPTTRLENQYFRPLWSIRFSFFQLSSQYFKVLSNREKWAKTWLTKIVALLWFNGKFLPFFFHLGCA